MRSIPALIVLGVTASLLAGCADKKLSEYPVQAPPLDAHEQQQVKKLVDDFSGDNTASSRMQFNDALKPLSSMPAIPSSDGNGSSSDMSTTTGSGAVTDSTRASAPSYSDAAKDAIKRKVYRQYKSAHERRRVLRSKYGITD